MASLNRSTRKIASLVYYQHNNTPAIKMTFPYDQYTVNTVKQLEGRRYHGDNKADIFWSAPANMGNIEHLIQHGFQLTEPLYAFLQQQKKTTDSSSELVIPGLKGSLFSYQQDGVRFLNKTMGRAIIGDEMGLGKTIQVLAWLQSHPEISPVLIITPASLKFNWQNEAEKWMNSPQVQVLSGSKHAPITGRIVIINYDIVDAWKEVLLQAHFRVVVMDEVHYIKSNNAHRTKAVKLVCKAVPHVIGLSGTPIVNRPVEFYNIINIVSPTFAPNRWNFLHRYCGAKNNGFGWDFSGATNTEELHERLITSIFIRRKKVDVLKELPDKQYSHVPLEISNEKEYRYAEQHFIDWLKFTKGAEAAVRAEGAETLTSIEALRQLAVEGKMNHVISWITDFLESGEKLVVMAVHKKVIDSLMQCFGSLAVKIDGSTPVLHRQIAVDRFQNDPSIRLFIGNIKAAGVGITLTASSNIAFVELPWTPGELVQAEDRCHRIGQKEAVTVWYLVAKNTIEDKMIRLLSKKKNVLDKVLDGGEGAEASIFAELLTNLNP